MKKWMQFLLLVASVSSAGALLASGGGEEGDSRQLPPVANAKWKAECSSCHMLYHPGLLPEKSWQKLMAGLDRHFGENAALDAPTRDEISRFLTANSADKLDNRRSRRIVQSIPADAAPLRISETAYFTAKHDEISATTFKRKSVGSASNCAACHQGAERGDFSENKVRIPR
ncbi:MAG TPA: diheme cytochrome c [Novimethylophilus sp.]|jgi:cytochrome c553|uniref:diheme cytochrome c n=1 Tax=Novimethylophilus sp. TaxID=2137426 RepID=UPI002F3E8400